MNNVLYADTINELGESDNYVDNSLMVLTKKASKKCQTCWGRGECSYQNVRDGYVVIRLCNCVLRNVKKKKLVYDKHKVYGGLKTTLEALKNG
jgi:hypothetical protein